MSSGRKWTIERESAVLDRVGGSPAYRFHARDAHLVMSAGLRDQIPFRVLLDGTPSGNAHGLDVDEEGHGLLEDAGLYQLVRQVGKITERTPQISFLESGAKAYALIFG